ncbi:winged helix-turn-helix domain-containing protein [Haloferax sulfurifontis]|uniref:winged helix-turn-helix domain-containing protein n=1 Tax=Haloferax sulfurifontis TaxID=255616 RepID=UPI000677DA50|nr:winged helix-turn-helix domain-containing protein [Haloferax sulfurifontis]
MVNKEWNPQSIFDLFGDQLARHILVLTSERAFSADELSNILEVSPPTVYRRVNELAEYDLLTEQQEIDEDGHHFKTFETTLKRVVFEIDDGGYNIDIQMRQSLVDQFESFWSEFEQSQPSGTIDLEGNATDRSFDETNHG